MKRKFTFLIAAALMLLTMMATTGTMWGQTTVTFTPGTDTGTTSVTKGDITATMTSMSNSSYYQIYANQSGTFSTSNGTITNIEFTCTASGTSKYGPGNASANVGTYTYSGYNGYWTGNAESVTISSTAQIRMTVLTITYTPTGGGDTPSLSVTPTAIEFGSKEINPDEPYTETFTVTYANLSENLTVSVGEGLTGISVSPQQISKDGDGSQVVTVSYNPTSEGEISGNITVSNTEDDLSKTVAVSGSSYDPANVVIYERYTGAIVEGDYIICANAEVAMKNVISSSRFANESVTVVDNKITNPDASIIWHIAADGDHWTMYNAAVNKYAGGTTSNNQGTLLEEITDYSRWDITYAYSNYTVTCYGRNSSSNKYLRRNGTYGWATYANNTGNPPTFYKKAGATTYSVTYNANGATSGTVPTDSNEYESSDEVTVLGNTGNLAKAGYVWAGWCMNAEGTGQVYGPGYTTTFEISGSTTLYAKWDAKTITNLTYSETPTATQYAGQAFNPAGLTVTATFNDNSQEDVTSQVVWTPNPLTIETTSVTGTYMGHTVVVEGITVTYAPGTENNPYTVAAAMAATPTSGTSANVYIHGIVSAFYNTSIVGDGSNYRYYISDDGTTTNQLLVYKGKGLNNVAFSNADDLLIGDEITLFGGLTIYQNAPEVAANNYIVSLERPVQDVATPTFSVAAGTYASAQEVEISCETDGATIYYTLDGTEPTNASTPYNGALNIETTTTVKAIAYKNTANSYVATATYHICSAETPYTVAQALAFNEYPTSTIWVHGIVSTAPTTAPSSGQLKYYISDNGEATNQLYIYNGKGLNNNAFTAQDDIQVGDIVTITGIVKDYQGTLEFDSGNYLTSFERPTVAKPTFTPGEGEYTEAQSVKIACATEGAAIYYTLDGTEPTNASTLYEEEISVVSTTTIKAIGVKAGLANSEIATATYTITIAPTASIEIEPASLSVDADAHEETFTVAYVSVDADLAEIRTCDEGGNDMSYDWFSATFASTTDHNNITCTIAANDGDARTAYFKVYALDDNAEDVYSNLVTINQAAYIAPSQEVVDVLDLEFTGVTGSSYEYWSDMTGNSGATYAGNSAGGNESIQLRSKNSSGIVTTTSGGKVTKVEVTWNENTEDGRTLNIYGSNTAYEATSDLYDDNAGTLIGTIIKGTSTELTISDEYTYIGFRSANNAMYLNEIQITWSTTPAGPSITVTPAEITDVSAAGDIPEHTVILANLNISSTDDFLFAYCDLEGNILGNTDPKPNWIELAEAEYTATGENVYLMVYTVAANEETTPRTGYFKIGIEQATETVYSNIVTVTQLGYVTPVATITVVPNEVLDVPAAGDVYVHTVTLENMTVESTDDFTLAFCDENGEVLDEQAPKPDWIEIGDVEFAVTSEENVYSLTYPVAENTETTPRTAYFKVAATQTSEAVYSNLVTVTQDGYVPPVVADNYELFSGTLVEGDYIIVYDGSAMNDEVSNDRLQFKSVTSVNNVISTDDATIVWHIAQSGDYWTIYSADANAYAASTGAKNKAQMLADGTDDKALWSVESTSQSETYDFVNKQNTTNNVNAILRNNKDTNNNYGFACYASGTGGALSLYKKVDNSPSISADNVNIEYNATSGSIIYEINNYVEGTMVATTEANWISVFTYEQVDEIGTVSFTTTTNASYVSRSATVTLTYSYGDPAATVTKDVTVTQAAAPIPTYIVSFIVGEGGTFVPNDDFDDEMVEVEAGTYTLPSATKEGYTFDGWNDGEQTYAAGVEYTVSYDVAFTATYTELQHITIHFVVNGEADNDMDVLQGTPVELPLTSTLTPDGFAITGWSSEPSSTVAVPNPYTPESEVTLYALLTYLYSEDSFELVTDASDLADGDIVVIAALNSDYAMSTTQNNNNRGQAAIVKSGNQIALSENVCEFVLGEGSTENTWSFYDAVNEGYIYAASSSSNYLRTETELSANSSWTISIEENAATITAQGSNTHNFMQYNSSSSIFSCYASGTTTQQPICIYKKNEASSFNYVNSITEPDAILDTNIPESTCYVVEDGAVLTFTGTNEGTAANLVVQEGGQLIHPSDVQATVQKSVAAYTAKDGDGWYLIASPVDNYSTSTIATGTYDLFIYNEPNAYWYSSTGAAAPFNTLERGKGYLYANAADVNLNYAGTMKATNANITVDLSYACDEYPYLKGFNLVGNPFTRNITDADMVIGEDAVTSYYDFNADRTEFVTYQTNERPIQPGQGFFIQATGNAQQLEFNPAPSKDASDFKYISISAGDENFTDKAYIQFGYGNTLRKMTFGENTMVYVMNNDDDYAAARVEELAGTMPVHFVPIEDGFYTITVETKNIENLNYMHLIDNIKNTEIDLLVEPSYTFKASESDNADRFYLVFDFNNYTGVNENYTNDNFAHQIGDEIFVSGEGTLQVFDVLGRFVTGYNVNGDKRISTAEFNTGVYIFRMVGTEVKTQKIIVR